MLARFAVLFIVLGMLAAAGAGSASVAVGAGADRAMARPIIRTPQPRPTVAILVATRTLEAPTVIPLATRTLEPPSAVPAATRTLTPPTLAPIFPTVTPQRPTQVPTIAHTPMMTALPVTVMPEYVAAEMVRAFAAECLGLNISVDRTYGAAGDLNLPEMIEEEVEAAVSIAGQVSVGSISAGTTRGLAEVAVGEGVISGDLDADISDASLGAYSILVYSAAPRNADAALDLLRTIYPALDGVDLVELPDSASNSYVFESMRVSERIDPGSLEVKATLQEVLAGTTKQGPATIAWVVVANGDLAAALQWP